MFALLLAAQAAAAATPPLKACRDVDPGSAYLSFVTQLVRAGDTVRIRPMVAHGPFGSEEVRWDCFEGWTVSGTAKGRLDPRKGTLTVDANAASGSTITVSAIFKKTRFVDRSYESATLRIIARDEQVLTGKWSEARRQNCVGDTIGELIFGSNGWFSFTFSDMMIETMTSGGGAFTWDAASKALVLNPGLLGVQSGSAELFRNEDAEPAVLMLTGIDFYPRNPQPPLPDGSTPPAPKCVLLFRRTG